MNYNEKIIFIQNHCTFDDFIPGSSAFYSDFVVNPYELHLIGIRDLDNFLEINYPKITPMNYSIIKRESCQIFTSNYSYNDLAGEIKYDTYQYICLFDKLYDVLLKLKAPIIKTALLK